MSDTPAVALDGVRFGFRAEVPVLALDTFTVRRGERVFLKGASGSGKSTLLGLVGGVLTPQAGRVSVLGSELTTLGTARRDAFRAQHIGFIFQLFNLLPYLSVTDNVLLPCRFAPERLRQAQAAAGSLEAEAERLLAALGLGDPALRRRRATELSIGQQQRVAAARALIGRPDLVIADEPTSSLDADARASFVTLLLAECAAAGSTVLFVSHDAALARHFDRTVDLATINRAAPRTAAPAVT